MSSDEATRSFQVNTVAPPAPAITARPSFPTALATPSFAWTAEEAAVFRWQVMGSTGASLQGPTDTPLPSATIGAVGPGAFSFRVWQIDPAGNVSAPTTDPFSVVGPVAGTQRPSTRTTLPRLNASKLFPRAGTVVKTRTPTLRWKPGAKGTTLYNLQLFKVIRRPPGKASVVRKVFTAFPRKTHIKLPAAKMTPGSCYVWRIWPYLGKKFTPKPLGISNFCVAKASVLKKAARARAVKGAAEARRSPRSSTRLPPVPSSISFARGAPCPEALATDLVADCTRAALEADGVRVLSYGTGNGYPPLRELLAAEHGASADQVLVTNGSLQGFVFLLETLLEPGDLVAVESPTYDRALLQLRLHGMRGAADQGRRRRHGRGGPGRGLRRRRVPRLLYTIPNFQNPSGATLSEAKRRRLIEVCVEHDILVLEDDPYGKLRFEGDPLPGLAEIAPAGRVIFTSSFSKTVAPGLRVGYLVSPTDLAARLASAASQTYISPALLSEAAIHQLIVGGHLPGNIARVTELMRERRDAMMEGMRHFPEGSRCVPPNGGFFCWVTLPEGLSADELFPRPPGRGSPT